MPAEPSQVVRGGNIAMATAGEYAFTALLWFVLSALIISAWTLLFEACWLTVPARLGRGFLSASLWVRLSFLKEQLRNRELAAVLASVKSDFVNRAPCETPQP